MEIIPQFGLFLAKTITVVIAIGAIILMVVSASKRDKAPSHIEVKKLNERYQEMALVLRKQILTKKDYKAHAKREKDKRKQEKKQHVPDGKRRVFVLNFKGDIKASAITPLREEITTILAVARKSDEVLVRLENAGGVVHGHGLAASQLMRLRERGIPLTISVDKVAASGGYMMACVAERIIAAPFAIVGSIGVLAQIPNFNRLLDSHGVDFEQFMAGEFKRTVTLFGKNTDEGRGKLQEEVADTHELFKEFVRGNRPALDIDQVATGEHWYGMRAIELRLVDELVTSDDYLLTANNDADVFEVSYRAKKGLSEKLGALVQATLDRTFVTIWQNTAIDSRFG